MSGFSRFFARRSFLPRSGRTFVADRVVKRELYDLNRSVNQFMTSLNGMKNVARRGYFDQRNASSRLDRQERMYNALKPKVMNLQRRGKLDDDTMRMFDVLGAKFAVAHSKIFLLYLNSNGAISNAFNRRRPAINKILAQKKRG